MNRAAIYLIRHGQTAWNKQRYQGWSDIRLNETGLEQAASVAERLRENPLRRVYSSPLVRAIETARPLVLQRRLPLFLSDDLREFNYGDLEGTLKADRPSKLRTHHVRVPVPGGESLADLHARAQRFVDGVRGELERGESIAVVGHYWSNRLLLGALRGGDLDSALSHRAYRPANASILRIDWASVESGDVG